MANANLAAVVRIKTMAREAAQKKAEQVTADEGYELAATYERLREEAKALAKRAGWGDDDALDRELPPLAATGSVRRLPRGMESAQALADAIALGRAALMRLGQLAAWAEGYQEAFELEAKFQADAQAKLAAAAKQPPGFSAPTP